MQTNQDTPVRIARVRGDHDIESVRALLPANYACFRNTAGTLIVHGCDDAGWTLDDYVLPRLASGLIFADESYPRLVTCDGCGRKFTVENTPLTRRVRCGECDEVGS